MTLIVMHELLAKAQREYDLDDNIEDAMNSLMGEIEEERRQKEEALKELAALKKLLNK